MRRWMVLLLLVLTACASPADVEASHARNAGMAQENLERAHAGVLQEQKDYEADKVFAQEWNTHTLGIPASGWVTILIIVSILGLIPLVLIGLWLRLYLDARRRDRLTLALEKERTEQMRLKAEKAQWDSVNPATYQTPPERAARKE